MSHLARRALPFVVFAMTMLRARSAASESPHGPFEAGPFTGVYSFSESNRLGRYDRDSRATSLLPGPVLGARIAYLPWKYLGAELQLSAIPTSSRSHGATATVLHTQIHAIAALPLGRFRPFALIGVTAATIVPADPPADSKQPTQVALRNMTELNLYGGVGLKFDPHRLFGVRVDLQTSAVPRTDSNGMAFDLALLLGIYGNFPWPPPPPLPFDKDGDFITDDKDECPSEKGVIRLGGCPDPNGPQDDTKVKDQSPAEADAGVDAALDAAPDAAPDSGGGSTDGATSADALVDSTVGMVPARDGGALDASATQRDAALDATHEDSGQSDAGIPADGGPG